MIGGKKSDGAEHTQDAAVPGAEGLRPVRATIHLHDGWRRDRRASTAHRRAGGRVASNADRLRDPNAWLEIHLNQRLCRDQRRANSRSCSTEPPQG